MTAARLCTAVLETGVRGGADCPHCIDEARCRARVKCFWRGFRQLRDDQYRKKQERAQEDLFA